MKIRLTRKLAELIDGIDLSHRNVGDIMDLSEREARILVAEGWAEPWASDGRHPLVLVVEDDEDLRAYYCAGLGGRFLVDECSDGMSALAYFDSHRPDAVVLDLNLPRLSGQAVYNELRHQPLTAEIPVVVVTGIDPVPVLPHAVILRKPCELDRLMDTLDRAITPKLAL